MMSEKKCLMKLSIILIIFTLTLSAAPVRSLGGALEGTIKIGGTGSAIGAMKELAMAFRVKNPGANIVIVPRLGTTGGINAVADRAIDIGLSTRPLKADEHMKGLEDFEYARTPFMLVTHRRTEGVNFTNQYIAKIYGGEIRTWPDGSVIRLILRPETDADTTLLRKISPEMERASRKALAREGMNLALTDQDSAEAVEKVPGAIGTSALSQMITEKRSFSPVPINGIAPDIKNATSGRYPYYKTFYMISSRKPAPVAKNFIEFVKSHEGREILVKTGHFFAPGH